MTDRLWSPKGLSLAELGEPPGDPELEATSQLKAATK